MAFAVLALSSVPSVPAQADKAESPAAAIPWGISSSSSSSRNAAEWLPKMAAAGVATVRLFPEWSILEPTRGTWRWEPADVLVNEAGKHKIEINAILMGSPPGSKKAHAFPMNDLDGWSTFVATTVKRYQGRVRYWEVWNEGNGGFNDDHHTTADYAKLALTTYTAVKKSDANAKVGLSVASFDAPYLHQTILALAKAGHPNSFDYLCIHPYEIADGLGEPDGEVPFLWMARSLRDMLKRSAPERADAEIWITEVGRRIEKRNGHSVTETEAAQALVKIYALALAQGIQRTQWFEAQDPVGEDAGFGLLNRDGSPRAAYKTLKLLTTHLGAAPAYQGWLALGRGGRGYGFVFQGASAPVLVAWMPAGQADKALAFADDVTVIDALSGDRSSLRAGQPFFLSDTPVLVVGVPGDLVKEARANARKNFPWGGDYTAAKVVSCRPAEADGSQGAFQRSRSSTPTVKFADGSTGILVRGDIGHPVSFYVHPSFADFASREYYIRVQVRRVGPGNVGMNLLYEVADSQGRAAYKNREQWFGATVDNGWQTHTWHVTDACFAKMWGFDFSLRPEQSVPYVIGKVEVSTTPFK
jgi:hypothetical protein